MKKSKKILGIIIFILVGLYYFYNEDFTKVQNNISNEQNVNQTIKESTSNLKVSFLNVGQADSILISKDGEYALIDAGNNEDGQNLVNYFKSLNINKFNYVIGTHAHEDHIGGMDDIINNFEIDTFYMPEVVTTTKTFEDVLNALENKSVAFSTPSINDTFKLSDCNFKVLSVTDDESNLNDTSIVLKMTYKNNSFLFMGDASTKIENNILHDDLKSDVLKVGHHGSRYSSSSSFLEKVNPSYAVIEVGENNKYNHPATTTINKLTERNIKVFRTDKDNTIIFTSDGNNLSEKTENTNLDG